MNLYNPKYELLEFFRVEDTKLLITAFQYASFKVQS